MSRRRHLACLVAVLLGLAQTACAPARRSFHVPLVAGPVDLTESVHEGDLVYVELRSGEALEGRVEAVRPTELELKDQVIQLEDMQRLEIDERGEVIKRHETAALVIGSVALGFLILVTLVVKSVGNDY